MTSPRDAAEVLAAARKRRATSSPKASPSAHLAEEPAPNSPADLGRVLPPTPRTRARPAPPDSTLTLEGVRLDPDGRWEATLERPDHRRIWLYAPTEAEVRAKAQKAIQAAGGRR